MNIFELTIPRTEHPKKTTTLPPSPLYPPIHPSIQHCHRKGSKTHTRKKKRRLTTYKNHAMKPNSSHSILRRTRNERSIPHPEFQEDERKFEKKISIEKKKMVLRVRLVYMLYIHTYIHTWYLPTIHIWGHSVHYLSTPPPSSFCFPPN